MSSRSVSALLAPRSIAVVGSARPGSVAAATVQNLRVTGFAGPLWAVNPKVAELDGVPAFPSLAALPEAPDCVMVCLPAAAVPDALAEASAAGARAAVVIASGFAENGDTELQQRVVDIALDAGMAVCGPNCLGVFSPVTGQACYTAPIPEDLRPGRVAVVSQSGTAAILLTNLGRFDVSHVVSTGNEAVTDAADYIDHLADDPQTTVVACFLESVRRPAAFSAAVRRATASGTTVVVLKVGRSQAAQRVSAAHTASLASPAEVYDRFLASTGAWVAQDFDDFVEMVELAQSGVRPRNQHVVVSGISGGANALLCDVAESVGLELPPLHDVPAAALAGLVGADGRVMNPFDAGFFLFDRDRHVASLEALAADHDLGVLAVCQDMPAAMSAGEAAIYTEVAERIAQVAAGKSAPVLVFTTVAGDLHPAAVEPLRRAGVPVLRGARPALAALAGATSAGTTDTPPPASIVPEDRWILRLRTGAHLTEHESTAFLADHGVPVTRRRLAASPDEAAAAAAAIGYPVALKVDAPGLAHKSDVGGVRLGLSSDEDVRTAYGEILTSVAGHRPDLPVAGVLVQEMVAPLVETIVGIDLTEPLGATVVVGAGGTLTELLRRTALDVLPHLDAPALLERSGLAPVLAGFRGSPRADAAALSGTVELLAAVATAYSPWLDTLEVNPVGVLADGHGVRVLDALVIPRKDTDD